MKRYLIFSYGVFCYLAFIASFLYAVGFVGNVLVPKSIDSEPTAPLGLALLIDAVLLAIFAIQHSIMARPAFKRWWTQIIPAEAERSTFVLAASAALMLLFWLWQPIGGVIWDVRNSAAQLVLLAISATGWGLVLVTTFLINHFDLFGLRQVWLCLRNRPYAPLHFVTPGPYKRVRHPLYLGFMLAFWSTPTMTIAHLVFAVLTTAYILLAIRLEERDLINDHGSDYAEYRRQVPMLIPRPGRGARSSNPQPAGNSGIRG